MTLAQSKVAVLNELSDLNKKKRRDVHRGDRVFFNFLRSFGVGTVLVLVGLGYQLFKQSAPLIQRQGFSSLFQFEWNPPAELFGAVPFIYGTLVSSALAIVIAAPVSIGVAIFLSELAPRKFASVVSFLIEMLAAIPSVVYGLWGIFVLAPWLRNTVEPWMIERVGFLPLFSGPAYGVGMLAAGIILAIMITPTISAITREVFSTIPRSQREAALSLGATRWECIRLSVLKSSASGISGAVILGLGRALGETMAVTMVIGNSNHILASLFAPSQTMASIIANEYAEASSDIHLAALAFIGLSLLGISIIINLLARVLVWRAGRVK